MDRTAWIAVIICGILLFLWGQWSAKEAAKLAEQRRAEEAAKKQAELEKVESGEGQQTAEKPGEPKTNTEAPAKPAEPAVAETKVELANEFVRLHLTNRGAGIQVAELLKHNKRLNDESEKISINETAKNPVGILSNGPAQFDSAFWTVKSKAADRVTFETDTPEGLHIEKTFSLPAETEDPYELGLEVVVRNDSGAPIQTGRKFIYAGAAAPLHFNEWSMQIGFYWLDGGKEFEYKTVDHFGGRKILGIFGKSKKPHDEFAVESLDWAGVNDQYFTTLIKPETAGPANIWASRYPVVIDGDEDLSKKKRMSAAEAAVGLPDLAMNAGDQTTLRYHIYMGPKELSRLRTFDDGRKRIMNYDQIPIFGWMFGWAIKPLASLLITGLVFLKAKVGGYGLAIILITILIRLLIWPVYAKSARSMKRMSKLTPKMQALKEKYADDPQKMNTETMKLYKKYGVNPLGSCLPMFIQLPVFLAFYRMLWSAVELRHESWAWVQDLGMPDTLFEIPGLGVPFNLLPILMAVSTFIQMAITPKTGDKTQQMIFMLMPFMFLFICYNFASALSLYWTTSNIFSIFQTWIMNKIPEPELKEKELSGKKGFFERLQEQAAEQQKARQGGGGSGPPAPGQDRTKMPGERGERHTKSKRKKKR